MKPKTNQVLFDELLRLIVQSTRNQPSHPHIVEMRRMCFQILTAKFESSKKMLSLKPEEAKTLNQRLESIRDQLSLRLREFSGSKILNTDPEFLEWYHFAQRVLNPTGQQVHNTASEHILRALTSPAQAVGRSNTSSIPETELVQCTWSDTRPIKIPEKERTSDDIANEFGRGVRLVTLQDNEYKAFNPPTILAADKQVEKFFNLIRQDVPDKHKRSWEVDGLKWVKEYCAIPTEPNFFLYYLNRMVETLEKTSGRIEGMGSLLKELSLASEIRTTLLANQDSMKVEIAFNPKKQQIERIFSINLEVRDDKNRVLVSPSNVFRLHSTISLNQDCNRLTETRNFTLSYDPSLFPESKFHKLQEIISNRTFCEVAVSEPLTKSQITEIQGAQERWVGEQDNRESLPAKQDEDIKMAHILHDVGIAQLASGQDAIFRRKYGSASTPSVKNATEAQLLKDGTPSLISPLHRYYAKWNERMPLVHIMQQLTTNSSELPPILNFLNQLLLVYCNHWFKAFTHNETLEFLDVLLEVASFTQQQGQYQEDILPPLDDLVAKIAQEKIYQEKIMPNISFTRGDAHVQYNRREASKENRESAFDIRPVLENRLDIKWADLKKICEKSDDEDKKGERIQTWASDVQNFTRNVQQKRVIDLICGDLVKNKYFDYETASAVPIEFIKHQYRLMEYARLNSYVQPKSSVEQALKRAFKSSFREQSLSIADCHCYLYLVQMVTQRDSNAPDVDLGMVTQSEKFCNVFLFDLIQYLGNSLENIAEDGLSENAVTVLRALKGSLDGLGPNWESKQVDIKKVLKCAEDFLQCEDFHNKSELQNHIAFLCDMPRKLFWHKELTASGLRGSINKHFAVQSEFDNSLNRSVALSMRFVVTTVESAKRLERRLAAYTPTSNFERRQHEAASKIVKKLLELTCGANEPQGWQLKDNPLEKASLQDIHAASDLLDQIQQTLKKENTGILAWIRKVWNGRKSSSLYEILSNSKLRKCDQKLAKASWYIKYSLNKQLATPELTESASQGWFSKLAGFFKSNKEPVLQNLIDEKAVNRNCIINVCYKIFSGETFSEDTPTEEYPALSSNDRTFLLSVQNLFDGQQEKWKNQKNDFHVLLKNFFDNKGFQNYFNEYGPLIEGLFAQSMIKKEKAEELEEPPNRNVSTAPCDELSDERDPDADSVRVTSVTPACGSSSRALPSSSALHGLHKHGTKTQGESMSSFTPEELEELRSSTGQTDTLPKVS